MERIEHLTRDLCCVKDFLLERASCYEASDWIAVKAFLVSMGILLGTGFTKFFKKIRPLITVIFFISGIFAFVRTFAPVFDNLDRD